MAELTRRNSIPPTTTTTMVGPTKPLLKHSPISAPPSLSLELISLKTTTANSYTSLRDIIPSPAVSSPSSAAAAAAAIRNRLVKQAAWAYLQPMSASPSAAEGPRILRRLWLRYSEHDESASSSCIGFFACHVITAVDRLLSLFVHVDPPCRR